MTMDVAKQYAMRNRLGNDWFGHTENKDVSNVVPAVQSLSIIEESPQPVSKAETTETVPCEPARENQKVEHVSLPVAEPITNSPAQQPFHNEHAAMPSSTPSKTEEPTSPPGSSGGRAKMVKPSCDSNQWYKFGQNGENNASRLRQQTTGKKARPMSQPVDWYAHDSAKLDVKAEGRVRVTDQEGAAYCRRDKMGSSAAWYGHSAAGSGEPNVVTPRVTSREGASNANRMRGESENWFSYGGSPAAREPVHMSKGRVAGRPQSNEMHSIFHHDG